MVLEDKLTLLISGGAFFLSILSLYFATWHKPAAAVLNLVERTYSPSVIDLKSGNQTIPQMRHLVYTLSNTGNRALYVKSVLLLRGPNALGYFHSHESFPVVPTNRIEHFVLPIGEVRVLNIDHETECLKHYPFQNGNNDKELVAVEVIGANGHRYLIVHDITCLGSSGPEIHHPIWDGVTLGRPVRESGHI